jgi:hypothetical protein
LDKIFLENMFEIGEITATGKVGTQPLNSTGNKSAGVAQLANLKV